MTEKKPEFREDDSWFNEEQLAQLTPADVTDDLHAPVPTRMVSNGEYMPFMQTPKQKEVENRIKELSDAASRKLGMDRRRFLATSGGMAACFLAMNEVFGRFFNVRPVELFEPAAAAQNGPPPNLFVLDDQLHIVRSSRVNSGQTLRAIAQGLPNPFNANGLPDELGRVNFPWNPALVGLPNIPENFQLIQVMKDIYLDSQMTVGIMSNNTSSAVPGAGGSRPPKNPIESEAGEFLSAPQTMGIRVWVNEIAGSTRMLGHGMIFPGVKGTENLDYMQYQVDVLQPDSWKGYTSANSAKFDLDPESLMRRWRLDDEQVAYPMYELVVKNRAQLKKHPGFFNINIHKGLSTNALPSQPELGNPADIPKAATDWPELNFIMYHACIRPGFWALNALEDVKSGRLRDGVPDILWCTEFAVDCARFPNVYAELGTTFASTVITFPTVCAHLLGQFLKYFGEDRVVFGCDSPLYGGPQWQIEALWRFEIPEDMARQYGYPRLTEGAKRKILGLNSARLYKLAASGNINEQGQGHGKGLYKPFPGDYVERIPESLKTLLEFPGYTADNFARARMAYQDWNGAAPRHTRFGWIRNQA
jgi:predicted TIM-barrel fold metal-dependent hydrolase